MSNQSYKYDVAFSFLSADESIAVSLNDLVQDRMATFLYSKRQEEVSGTDGERTFNEVFGEQSRIVVVIYRDGWGTTPWTRIEETAIRNRGFKEGYDFVVFVPVEKGATLPKWLPFSQIYVDWERWGPEGAASVIETRVRSAGGEPRTETAAERAQRLSRELRASQAREMFLHSEEGVRSAKLELQNAYLEVKRLIEEIRAANGLAIQCTKLDGGIDICAHGYCVGTEWLNRYANTLKHAVLKVGLYKGNVPRVGRMFPFEEPKLVREWRFQFERRRTTEEFGWVERNEQRFLSSCGLADRLLNILMEHIHAERVTGFD